MEYGADVKFFQSIRERGKRTPLDEMPKNEFSYDWYYQAYSVLRYSKNENGYIPLVDILSYTDHFELIGSKTEFIHVMRGLESAENKYFKNKSEEEENKKQKKGNSTEVNLKR